MLGKYHQSGFETFLNISFVGVHECLLAKRLFAIIHCLIFCLNESRTEIVDGSDFKIFRKHVRISLPQYSMYLCFIYIIIIIIVRLSVCWSILWLLSPLGCHNFLNGGDGTLSCSYPSKWYDNGIFGSFTGDFNNQKSLGSLYSNRVWGAFTDASEFKCWKGLNQIPARAYLNIGFV